MDNQDESIDNSFVKDQEEFFKNNILNNSNDYLIESEDDSLFDIHELDESNPFNHNNVLEFQFFNRNKSNIQEPNKELKEEEESTKINSGFIIEIKKEFPNQYLYDDILKMIFNKLNISNKTKEKFIKTEQTEEIEKKNE